MEQNTLNQWMTDFNYSPKAKKNMLEKVIKRADKILEWSGEDVYQFRLEQLEEYKILSVSVRSQIKKAVKLYSECWLSQKEKVD